MEAALRFHDAAGMRTSRLALFLLAIFALCGHCVSQAAGDALLARAAELNQRGDFRATIALLKPVFAPDVIRSKESSAGVGLILLGAAYQYLGAFDDARRCYERAMQILGADPEQRRRYASAVDDLGAVDLDAGQVEASRVLREKAHDLFVAISDHAGTARTASDLALIALRQRHYRLAERLLDEAFKEERRVPSPTADDLGSIYSVQFSLESLTGDSRAALETMQRAIHLWESAPESGRLDLAVGYSLRGRAYADLGDFASARRDFETSLDRLRAITGPNSSIYLTVAVGYAKILRKSGDMQSAAQVESSAKAMLSDFEKRQCAGCTVNVNALR
jgi:tetratricopeptide (TPR) repeat protein